MFVIKKDFAEVLNYKLRRLNADNRILTVDQQLNIRIPAY